MKGQPYTVALDFDGTVYGGTFTAPDEVDGPPIAGAIDWVRGELARGHRIIIHTCRLTPTYPGCPFPDDGHRTQGAKLIAEEYSANAIVFVITDGLDYCGSTATPSEVKKAIQRAMKAECLESIVTVLIGVNVQESMVADALKRFSTEAGFTQYVELADANASSLAKLASFVSRSISSQSQSLGTGGPSKALTF